MYARALREQCTSGAREAAVLAHHRAEREDKQRELRGHKDLVEECHCGGSTRRKENKEKSRDWRERRQSMSSAARRFRFLEVMLRRL